MQTVASGEQEIAHDGSVAFRLLDKEVMKDPCFAAGARDGYFHLPDTRRGHDPCYAEGYIAGDELWHMVMSLHDSERRYLGVLIREAFLQPAISTVPQPTFGDLARWLPESLQPHIITVRLQKARGLKVTVPLWLS